MLALALIGGLIVSGGLIMIVSPLWISEQNRRNLDRIWGPDNFVSKSLSAQKDPLRIYRRLGAFAVALGLIWIAVPVAVMLGVLTPSP
jgi:hypothetical protein